MTSAEKMPMSAVFPWRAPDLACTKHGPSTPRRASSHGLYSKKGDMSGSTTASRSTTAFGTSVRSTTFSSSSFRTMTPSMGKAQVAQTDSSGRTLALLDPYRPTFQQICNFLKGLHEKVGDSAIVLDAFKALHITAASDFSRASLVDAGGVEAIVTALGSVPGDVQVQCAGLKTLRALDGTYVLRHVRTYIRTYVRAYLRRCVHACVRAHVNIAVSRLFLSLDCEI
eukprot:gnl/MRDRNA2_/MRDRNA2_170720_c0_seq1.p1 gnl/MRDRNA2_/MRDRNA2_170720_c0~~gnl/MRDRNA2_/MRDRNA2_170720_c0_seq1.p1  ORF type:complete len:253 (-),score=25.97 gnl/MRDRNA2_/MRDRNA2_170720_c0_seq1:173-850(-)